MNQVKYREFEDGKFLAVYDDIFPWQRRHDMYNFMLRSMFYTHGSDNDNHADPIRDYQLYSAYTDMDVEYLGFLKSPHIREIYQNHGIDGRELKQVRVNLCHLGEKNRVHGDGYGITVLYYANLEWRFEWGGHLMFVDDTGEEVIDVVTYKPGRVLVFSGNIPHAIMPPTVLSPLHRFSYVMQYDTK